MVKDVFINLPIKSVKDSREFFSKLGFTFNDKGCSDDTLCMIINENVCAMFLEESKFKDFASKEIVDVNKASEVVNVLSMNSREEVDELVQKAIDSGGKEVNESKDYGPMHGRNFEDLDGHVWGVFFMGMMS